MKKKKTNAQHKLLKEIFGRCCYDLRCDDETYQVNGDKISYKSVSMQKLAELFSKKIEDKYDASKISRLENTKAEVNILDLYLYHEHYKVSYNYLMGETKNKKEQYNGAWEKYGLSDKTLDILKYFVASKKYEKELIVLNEIFESGIVQPLLDALYDYFHNDYEKRFPPNYKFMGGEMAEIKMSTKAGNIDLGEDILPLDKMKSLYRQIVYDKLEQVKQILNNK